VNEKSWDAAAIQAKIEYFEMVRDELGDALTDRKLAELRQRLAALERGAKSDVVTDDQDPHALDQRDQFVLGPQTNITGTLQAPVLSGQFGSVDLSKHDHFHGTGVPVDAEQAEAVYRKHIADRCAVLPLQSIEVTPAGGEAEPLSLAQVYIALDTRQSAPTAAIEEALGRAGWGEFGALAERKLGRQRPAVGTRRRGRWRPSKRSLSIATWC
jgi:hypothetical protein